MALAGHIADFPLAELLFFLSNKQRTGQLVLKRPLTTMIFTLRRGRLIAGQMVPADQRIGDRLVADGVLNAGLLAVALEVQRQDPQRRPVGSLLVELGYVQPEDVKRALRRQIADCLFRFLVAPDGVFTFREKAIDAGATDVDVNVEAEVLEAIRRADEWLVGRMDSSPIYLNQRINTDALKEIIYDRWAVVDAMLHGARTVEEIVAAIGRGREQVIETVILFQTHGAVDFEKPSDNPHTLLVPSHLMEEKHRRESQPAGAATTKATAPATTPSNASPAASTTRAMTERASA